MNNTIEKALDAYFRKAKREGIIFMQPSAGLSKVGRKYIYLNNCNGLLAKYNMQTQRFI